MLYSSLGDGSRHTTSTCDVVFKNEDLRLSANRRSTKARKGSEVKLTRSRKRCLVQGIK